ncbi:MAG: serine protease [Xanthomonadaceae bacterium]|nr:serine protease [Xanthomonadaceae bacterium]MDP2185678.1 serine protease [Xanthomonadales bacterium]MDZ4116618.1 PA domain-containing protein [Xanthomonadaceae bacterium]MDZ4376652.1 PA domain-containing protein [Xanthomonadaceae bacterium]
MNKLLLAAALSLALATTFAQAATIVPVNFDGPGEGYNDTTPALPVGGNPGTTVGEQRLIVAQFAADLWGAVLQSDVPVFVGAQFNPLAPNVLGSAGATLVFRDFPGAGVANTWYSSALADAISGVDLQPGFIDINSQFSSTFTFYLGLDGNTPAGQVNFLDVVMHEFGHGLGFQNFENEAAGTFLAGTQDIYSTFTFDNSTGKRWTEMSVAERQASALNYGKVIFDGASAVAGAALTLGPRTAFRVSVPAAIAGDYDFGTASFGPAATPANFAGMVVQASPANGCNALDNPAAIAGNIAIIDRGTCGFVVKAANAQAAGAAGVVIANNTTANPPPGLGGTDPTITIPTISVTQADGNLIKAQLPAVQVGLVIDPARLQGADDAGRPRLFMPNPVQGGSSGSHYDSNMLPNALMEPAINSTLFSAFDIDISPNLLQDTGWVLNGGNAKIAGCDTTIDVVDVAGIIVGANVQATSNLCLSKATNRGSYQSCMDAYKDRLLGLGLITGKQGGKMMSCAAKVGK